jgi:hypothetical protein
MNSLDPRSPAFASWMDKLSPQSELVLRLAERIAFPESRKDRYARARVNALIAHVAPDVESLAQALQEADQAAAQIMAKGVPPVRNAAERAVDAQSEQAAIAEAKERLRLTQEQVNRQRRIVEQLRWAGDDTTEAEELLRTFEDGLKLARDLLRTREALLQHA